MEQSDEIVIPEIEEKPHRNLKLPLGIAAVCVIVFAIAAVVIARVCLDEKRALLKGVRNLAEETQERQELTEQNGTNAVKETTVFNVSVEDLPVTLGVDTVILRDADARKMQASIKIGVMNYKLAALEIYGEDETLMLAVPTIWEKNFAFDTSQIDKQYNDSVLGEKWGRIEMPEETEVSIDLFSEPESLSSLSWKDMLAHCLEIIEELEIERLEKEVTISIPEKGSRVYQCSQYRVVMPAVEVMGADYADKDMMLLVFVDEDDRIIQISLEEPFSIPEGKLTGDIYFAGEARSIDDIIVNMQLQASVDIAEIDESLLSVWGDEDTELTVEAEMAAEIVYNENDTSVSMNLDKLTVSVAQVGALKISGTMTLEPLWEEITLPERETIWVAEMTEDEYDALEEQFTKKMLLLNLLNGR